MEHLYQSWKVTREDVANPVTFYHHKRALDWWSEAIGTALIEMKVQRIKCGKETRGFCGHCDNGVPLVPELETAQS